MEVPCNVTQVVTGLHPQPVVRLAAFTAGAAGALHGPVAAAADARSDTAPRRNASLPLRVPANWWHRTPPSLLRARWRLAAGQLPDPVATLGVNNLPVNGPDAWSLTPRLS